MLHHPKKAKTPEELVDSIACCVHFLVNHPRPGTGGDSESTKDNVEEKRVLLTKRLSQIKSLLFGDNNSTQVDLQTAASISTLFQQNGVILLLLSNLVLLPFESRKDTAHIFNNLIRNNTNDFATYVDNHFHSIVQTLVLGYNSNNNNGSSDVALCSGSMLRECIRHEHIARRLLYDSLEIPNNNENNNNENESNDNQRGGERRLLWLFFDEYVHNNNFEIASDAFNTLRDLLTANNNNNSNSKADGGGGGHRRVSAQFLDDCYDDVMLHYEKLLLSTNFVTRWRSVRLLGDIVLDAGNRGVMTRFVADKRHLKTVMTLLRDKSPNIQFEAFHVFKVFVVNPDRPRDVQRILANNSSKLVHFLQHFQHNNNNNGGGGGNDARDEEEQFMEEKMLLIETLSSLGRVEPEASNIDETNKSPFESPMKPTTTTSTITTTTTTTTTTDVSMLT